ncbi:hypothetical protein FB446DRAFT_705439 [Lentinula raphanica]|nr:hypothetical protein FB446DRAFT_705439 [Lentinula raphanica]
MCPGEGINVRVFGIGSEIGASWREELPMKAPETEITMGSLNFVSNFVIIQRLNVQELVNVFVRDCTGGRFKGKRGVKVSAERRSNRIEWIYGKSLVPPPWTTEFGAQESMAFVCLQMHQVALDMSVIRPHSDAAYTMSKRRTWRKEAPRQDHYLYPTPSLYPSHTREGVSRFLFELVEVRVEVEMKDKSGIDNEQKSESVSGSGSSLGLRRFTTGTWTTPECVEGADNAENDDDSFDGEELLD